MPQFESQEIRNIVNDIRNSAHQMEESNREFVFRAKYPEFAEALPKLFLAAINNDFPLTYLEFMLQHFDKLVRKDIDINAADETVIGRLRTDYVEPIIANIKPEQSNEVLVTQISEECIHDQQ